MKAIVQQAYGGIEVLALREVDAPVVRDDEVLVRVRASSVHPDVWHVMRGEPYALRLMGAGVRRPKKTIPGTEVAGVVETLGKAVTQFQVGDEVFGETHRGHQWANGGGFAEYVSVPQESLVHKPSRLTFEQAAAIPTAGLIALQNLCGVGLDLKGRKVLVNGAGGGVGSTAVQLAKAEGAHVTGVDRAEKLNAIRSLGADEVIDFSKEDFTRGRERYSLIFDVPGNHPFSACRRALTPEGKYLLIGHDHFGAVGHRVLGSLPRFLGLVAMSPFVRQLPRPNFSPPPKKALLTALKALVEAGKLTPLVDRTFPLAQVPEAMRYLQGGQATGKIVITV
jgi:NADPH:quinone reductase-like Zn-dependent oxidoreductase